MSTAATTGSTTAADLVPIADRLRYMQAFRVVLALVVGAFTWVQRDALMIDAAVLGGGAALYVVLTFGGYGLWRLVPNGGKTIFGSSLIVDGAFLAWASYGTGGALSPVRYLIILHLIAVALLASNRTGMKLALWHSLLLLVTRYLQEGDVIEPTKDGTDMAALLAFSGVFWFVAIVTSSFAAVNERELRRRRYDLEALAAMARRLEEENGSAEVAEGLVDRIADTFDLDRCAVVAGPDGDELRVLAFRGEVQSQVRITPGEGSIVRAAMETRRTRLVTGVDSEDAGLAGAFPDARNLAIVPLSADRQAIGVLVIEHPKRLPARIERRVVGMLERFAAHGALALRNAWLLEQVQHLAATDGLTGLANRSTFQRTLGLEVARSQRTGEPVSLLLLDLDHFKHLNDTWGHQTGDEVLRRVAAVLDESCRGFDLPARYGGEEFAVVLPSTSLDQAVSVAERLREMMAGALIEPSVTISVGVATVPHTATSAEDLVRAADEALYASKRGGRDRVSAAPNPLKAVA
jgi:diguanylate cyclase (GGDEF)-like protein